MSKMTKWTYEIANLCAACVVDWVIWAYAFHILVKSCANPLNYLII